MGINGLWLVFGVGIVGMLALDLGVLQRRAHAVGLKEAAFWCLVWLGLALGFAAMVWHTRGRETGLQFLAGYLLEQSLSMDNMFVFVMIFHYFAIPPVHQPRILHWGILGAVVMRFLFIYAGIGLVNAFHWMLYVFGVLLVVTGAKMAVQGDEPHDPRQNFVLRLMRGVLPVAMAHRGQEFFTYLEGQVHATPLFAALIVVEFSDVIFALDSIPAVIAVTRDPFVVYTSNVFAIMGLRSLYFLLAGMMGRFRYLKLGISAILCFVGVKMLLAHHYEVPIGASLAVIAALLALSVLASLAAGPKKG